MKLTLSLNVVGHAAEAMDRELTETQQHKAGTTGSAHARVAVARCRHATARNREFGLAVRLREGCGYDQDTGYGFHSGAARGGFRHM